MSIFSTENYCILRRHRFLGQTTKQPLSNFEPRKTLKIFCRNSRKLKQRGIFKITVFTFLEVYSPSFVSRQTTCQPTRKTGHWRTLSRYLCCLMLHFNDPITTNTNIQQMSPLNFSRTQMLKFQEPQMVSPLYAVKFLSSLNLPFL